MLEFKNVTTKEDIKELKENSAFTFENVYIGSETLDQIYELLHDQFNVLSDKDIEIYKFSGFDLKEAFPEISDDYSDDIILVSIPLEAFVSIGGASMVKMQIGARWLDDIVDNLI